MTISKFGLSTGLTTSIRISKPDWKESCQKANEIHLSSRVITTFPFSAVALCQEQSDCAVHSYAKAAQFGIEAQCLGSDSALLISLAGRSLILFNEKQVKERIRFSLLHELGHCVLGHQTVDVAEAVYDVQEVESNNFVAQLLMPEQLLLTLYNEGFRIDREFIGQNFGVSKEAAEKRLRYLHRASRFVRSATARQYDRLILQKYADFLADVRSRYGGQADLG